MVKKQPVMFASTRPAVQTPPSAGAGGGSGAGRGSRPRGKFGSTLASAAAAAAVEAYDFSLAGILKTAESTGYGIVDAQVCDNFTP